MAKYKAYPEYKDSGVEWLGKIPSGWLLKKAKYIFQRIQRPLRNIDGVVTAFRDGQVTLRTNRRTDGFTNSVKEIGYQGVRRNDLVIHAMDGFAGAIGVSDSDGKCSPVCSVCIPWKNQSVNMRFYGYLVRQLAVTDYILSLAKGIRERSTEFRFTEFSGLMLPIPPVYEQNQIAAFLVHETAKIDNLIEKQQQLIELLKEKRQAVISHAVTKGLNPDVPMKDSGVEWLGEVPEHWNKIKLKHITNQIIDAEHKTAQYFDNGEFLVCRTANVKNGKLCLDGGLYTNLDTYNKWIKRGKPEIGDILFTREAPAGEACIFDGSVPLCLGQRMVLFKLKKTLVDSEFVLHSIYSGLSDDFVKQLSQGSTVSHFNISDIQNLPLYEPPLNEQKEIIKYLNCNLSKFDALIISAENVISLLQERRTALISAAVTGKIDVRDWVAPDTQKTEEAAA
ncbi:restriction endonuclease subunit S [Morganella morganii]|uniref:restriction endonuclease subunit S n=1 Tax=Morganella morganii TaxID=582 RepID=UPI0022AE114F|nr:restriction endonuclease subunit S [Morganella morganii]